MDSNRALLLLSPIIVGTLATAVLPLFVYPGAYHDPQFTGGLFFIFGVLYASIFMLLSYGAVLTYNVVRLLRKEKLTHKWSGLISPLVLGVAISLLTGLFPSPLQSDSNGEPYLVFYGFPAAWRWLPTLSCPENAVLNYFSELPPLKCQPGFYGTFLAYDILIYIGVFLWLNYALTLFSTVPPFNSGKWPLFLPRVSARDRTGLKPDER